MHGNRKLKMVYAYIGASTLVTLATLVMCWQHPEHLAAAIAADAGWCGGLATGVGLGVWGNAREHEAKANAGGEA